MTNQGQAPGPGTERRLLDRLKASLPAALPTALDAAGSDPAAGNDLYEAYLFSLVLRAAGAEGYAVDFRQSDGGPTSEFRLRRGPGRLPTGDFTHAVLSHPGTSKSPLEVHTGAAVIGTSKVAHEADVLVLRQDVADRCRRLRIDPNSTGAVIVVEGKYYTRPLSLGMGRQFLGLDSEMSRRATTILAATVVNKSVMHLLQGRDRAYDLGVLPGLKAEHDLKERFAMILRGYRNGP